jgi:very-short-patch-repair endonuclease
MPHSPVSTQQRSRAKSLRRTMTRPETLLWRYLKAGHLDGLSFRRQVPMKTYIADFVCHSARLIIELDGESHDFESQHRYDARRDAWFRSQGYSVLRFTNDDVMGNLEGVLEAIRAAAPPSLSLPHKGGGNPQTTSSPMESSKQLSANDPDRDSARQLAVPVPSPLVGDG